jgi:hypothetical protein
MRRLMETLKAAGGLIILCECLLVLASPYCMDKYMQHWVASSPWMILWWALFCVPAAYLLSNHTRAARQERFDREHAARLRCKDPRDAA